MNKVMSTMDMVPISINEFITGTKIPVDIYIKLSDDKFVLIAKAGAATEKDQLTSYKNKEVAYLWVERKDYGKITSQHVAIAGIIVSKDRIDPKQKAQVLTQAAQTVFNQFEHAGISPESYQNAKVITEATVALVESHIDLATLMESIAKFNDHLLAHSMAVSALATIIGSQLGWTKKVTLEKLALGGLLHDIGIKTLPPDLMKKPLVEMTQDEIQIFETHSFRGMQLMHTLGIVPDDVVSIVYEHHENAIGQGYPQRLRDLKMHPLAKVVSLADQFCTLTMSGVNTPIPKNPREAIMYIEHTMGQPFNKEAFRALKKIVEGQLAKSA